jgi:hypothetical protein
MSAEECQNKGIIPEYIRYLLVPEHHQPPVAEVRLVQTHISYVVIAGDLVYKWKKPVNFGFVDFSSLIKRRFYCLREVQLNRRLCPGYLPRHRNHLPSGWDILPRWARGGGGIRGENAAAS